MKKVLLFSVLIFLLTPKVSAEIKEGKSTVNTSVTTNVNSSSNSSNNSSETKTHIEIEVNGEKKVLDTTESGTHTLSIEKDGGKSSATVKIEDNKDRSNNSLNEDEEEGAQEAIDDDGEIDSDKIIKNTGQGNMTILQKFFDQVSKFLENLFNFF